ncbi:MAG: hypothetical protein MSIBF_05700 [Candidatus Altiarchaeales archaeon IMC4]|nr:MAG: hypothetical protein MSIBF_05700 [Candidatus Altiarchaeales archaeon IMC4]
MRLNEFIDSVNAAANKFFLRVEILAKTENAVKIRINLSGNIFLQFYYNQESNTSNYVLVGWNRRLYGRDSVGGRWHRHPADNPDEHDTSKDGKREVSPDEFLEEALHVLKAQWK